MFQSVPESVRQPSPRRGDARTRRARGREVRHRATQEISVPPSAATVLAPVQAPWNQASSGAAALLSGRATQHPMQPPAFAVAGLRRKVSGIVDRLHRLWNRPGQTLRGRVNHRARESPKVLLNFLPTNIRIVRTCQYHRDNNELVELSVLRY